MKRRVREGVKEPGRGRRRGGKEGRAHLVLVQRMLQVLDLRPCSVTLSIECVYGQRQPGIEIQISSFRICERGALAAQEDKGRRRREDVVSLTLLTSPRTH